MAAPAVEIEHVTKHFRVYLERMQSAKERIIKFGRVPFDDFTALNDVSFEVAEGETMGLLGHNGSGKSTLLKCIAGTLRPNAGSIRTRGRVAALLELGSGFHPDLTGRENVYLNGSILGLSKSYIDRVYDDIVEFSGIGQFIDNQVKHYSSGMYARLAFAVAVNVDPDILLIDEVLAVGDEAFSRKCIERVKQFQDEGRTILVVSHMPDMMRRLCDRVAVLDHGNLIAMGEPGPSIRVFREALERGGLELEPEAEAELDAEVEATAAERELSKLIRFTDVRVEYPGSEESFTVPGGQVRVRARYDVREPVDDVVFAINVHDVAGNLLLGANTDVLDCPVDRVEGPGEVCFDFDNVGLLDGTYQVSLGVHTHDGGTEYDHRDQLEAFQVMNPYQMVGTVYLPLKIIASPETP